MRPFHWTLILAILGFILGLGFLVPIPQPTDARAPAAVEAPRGR